MRAMGDDPVFVCTANRTQDGQNFGGHLVATRTRISFAPTPTNQWFGGEAWSADLASVREVGAMPRTWNRRDGGLRTRLRIAMSDGPDQLFVVWRVKRAVAVLSELVDATRAPV